MPHRAFVTPMMFMLPPRCRVMPPRQAPHHTPLLLLTAGLHFFIIVVVLSYDILRICLMRLGFRCMLGFAHDDASLLFVVSS
jgi:hypothetical protein